MSIIQGNAKQGSTRGFYDFPIEQSLRFNDDDNAYLSWTPASAGNRKTWTLSLWTKRGRVDNANRELFGTASEGDKLAFSDSRIFWFNNGSASSYLSTTALFRDPSAWYHIVLAFDTTQATASNRVKLYVNGEQVAFDNNTTFPSQNYDGDINNAEAQFIGMGHSGTGSSYDGYLAEVNFIDGTALDASSFGELKNGVWIPKDPSELTYGTNGFRLSFADDAEVEAFNTTLHRGNGGTQSITGMGFAPDFVWIKNRDNADNHYLFDAVRGAFNGLNSDTTSAEVNSSNDLSSFDSDGFSIGSDGGMNRSGQAYVAWGWKAGGAPTVDNSAGAGNVPTAGSVKIDGVNSTSALAGTIPATRLSASTTYGFSVVSYTANNTNNSTIAHGLGAVPDFVLVTARNFPTATNWAVWHSSLASIQHYLRLNTTDAVVTTDNSNFGTVDPTSTVMNLGYAGSTNSGTYNYIMYCWAEKTGYSKFGSYSGSRTAGQTVTCGFRPAFLLVKNINQSGSQGNWMIVDGTRETTNSRGTNILYPNASSSESTIGSDDLFDFTDTGFDVLNTGDGTAITAQMNGQGDTIIYAAFADTREAAFWLDQSGNDNDWQPVNLDHNDTLLDSPTNNFCTMNPIAKFGTPSAFTLADGNLDLTFTATSGNDSAVGTMGITSGKFYYEVELVSHADDSNAGFTTAEALATETTTNGAAYYKSVGYHRGDRAIIWGTEPSPTQRFTTLSDGSVLGFALDLDSTPQTLKIYLNGGASPIVDVELPTDKGDTWIPCCGDDGGDAGRFIFNFGQQPFKYDPPA